MGFSKTIEAGPFLSIQPKVEKIVTEEKEKIITICSNPDCRQHKKRHISTDKFCSKCGSAIRQKRHITPAGEKIKSIHYFELLNIHGIEKESFNEYFDNILNGIDWKYHHYDINESFVIYLNEFDTEKEIAEFKEKYKKEIDIFEKSGWQPKVIWRIQGYLW